MLFVKAFLLMLFLQWRGVGQFEQVIFIKQRQTAMSFALLGFFLLAMQNLDATATLQP